MKRNVFNINRLQTNKKLSIINETKLEDITKTMNKLKCKLQG